MGKEHEAKRVNLNEFYDITGIAPSTVRTKLVPEGMRGIERSGTGRGAVWQINTREAIRWLIEKKARELLGAEEKSDSDEVILDEDRRLKRLRGDKIELELARERGEVIPIAVATDIIREIAFLLGSSFDGLASTLADDLCEQDDPAAIKQLLLDNIRKLRNDAVERAQTRLRGIHHEILQ